jgi:MazG family protein
VSVADVAEVLHNWEALKADERRAAGEVEGALDGVPRSLPALAQAAELQDRAARVGFDWPHVSGVVDKVVEELAEVAAAPGPVPRAAEVGDLLFSVVNYARWLEVDPESALRQASDRFRERFGRVEAQARSQGIALKDLGLDRLNDLWEASKGGA